MGSSFFIKIFVVEGRTSRRRKKQKKRAGVRSRKPSAPHISRFCDKGPDFES